MNTILRQPRIDMGNNIVLNDDLCMTDVDDFAFNNAQQVLEGDEHSGLLNTTATSSPGLREDCV